MGNFKYEKCEIISNDYLGEDVYKMVVKGNFEGKPGQFYMLRSWENDPLLSRPLGVVDIDKESITFLYMKVGRGTDIFSKLKPKDNISIMGPRGNGFKLGKYKKVALLAGSVGLAPMMLLAKSLDCKIDLYAGFREYDFFVNEFKGIVDNIYISSDNGKVGFHGNVLQLMKEKNQDYDMIFACGPMPMMKALAQELDNDKLQLSLEARMGCGFGVCLGCGIKTYEGTKRVCVEGPIFFASEVDFFA